MHWKKWPYWLRGGVIGGGIALVSTILTHFCEFQGLGPDCVLVSIPWLILVPVLLWHPPFSNLPLAAFYPFTIPIGIGIYFFLGAVVGGWVGYLKKHKVRK